MEQKRIENQFPPAMQDMGAPDEKSDTRSGEFGEPTPDG